jgi:hypothetical protein
MGFWVVVSDLGEWLLWRYSAMASVMMKLRERLWFAAITSTFLTKESGLVMLYFFILMRQWYD